EPVEIGRNARRLFARRDRDAVIAGLAAVDDAIPELRERPGRKLLVLALRFLHREHVGLCRLQPLEHLLEAHAQAVDVPGRDLHRTASSAVSMPACFSSGSSCGARPRNATNESSASRLPPTASTALRKRSAVARSNAPASSNAANASAASTSAHL